MLNKLFFILSILYINIAMANQDSFSGFYFGGNIGITHHINTLKAVDITIYDTMTNISYNHKGFNKKFNFNQVIYGIHGGYGQLFNNIYLGIELNADYGNISKKNTYLNDISASKNKSSVKGNGILTTTYESDRTVGLGISPRVGVVINNHHLMYFKLLVKYMREKFKSTYIMKFKNLTSPAISHFEHKNYLSYTPGIGYEYSFGKIIGRLEYGYKLRNKININNISIENSSHIFKVGLSYRI